MKKIAFSALLACSLAFAQADFAEPIANEDAAFAELESEIQGATAPSGVADGAGAQEASAPEESTPAGSSWEQQPSSVPAQNSGYTVDATVKETSPVTTAPTTPREETWEESWQKRRLNVSFFMGFFPVTALGEIFVAIIDDIAGEEDSDPDLMAYSIGVGYELFYLLEVGVMVDYTTINKTPLISIIPRIKLNWLNFKYFRLYSYGGLGGVFWNGGGFIMFNFAVLGFEVGNHLSLFFEGGWGQVGLFTMGVKFAF